MVVRNANKNDLVAIVDLLKLSLGESLMPKSEAFWHWKHVENPFGESPVLLAEENNELIGVRAFLIWHWFHNGKVIKAARAVDTATHPKHQGKGIFKKLTLQLLNDCKQRGVQFVFNTPNKNSMPGYLKMGWIKAGKFRIRVRYLTPFERWWYKKYNVNELSWNDFISQYQFSTELNKTISTPKDVSFLLWRYKEVPVAKYFVLKGEENEYVIYRLKIGKIKELRIVEYLSSRYQVSESIWNKIKIIASLKKVNFITISGSTHNFKKGISLPIGPRVTLRQVCEGFVINDFDFKHWSPSIVDLELF